MILGIFDGSRNNNCIGFMIVDAYELHLGDNNSLQQVYWQMLGFYIIHMIRVHNHSKSKFVYLC